jgi:hypothetical protein
MTIQARNVAIAAIIAAAALYWALTDEPAESNWSGSGESDAVSAAKTPAEGSAEMSPGVESAGLIRAAPYTPGELQNSLFELLALSEESAPPGELLLLAQDIYLELLSAGPAAIPEVLDFLASGQDLLLVSQPGSGFDYQSLRLALIDALRQIGGADVERAFAQELQRTQSHAELEALAAALEWLQPGVYSEAILDRALTLLSELKSGFDAQFRVDSAPLFRVLQSAGDRDMISILQRMPHWLDGYAEVALANLPGGQGLDILARLARRDLRRLDESRALHLLAQLAVAELGAEQALLDLALAGSIPDQVWPLIGDILMGDRYLQLEEPPIDPRLIGSLRGSNPFAVHTISDRQVQSIYAVNYSAVLSPQEAATRMALIDRFLDAPLSPAARDALWAAYDLLDASY